MVICLSIELADGIHRVPPPKQLYAQLHARLSVKINERPITSKASHPVKIIVSYQHLLASNMGGVGSVPPPLSQALHQDGTRNGLWQQTDDGLKARSPYVAIGLLGHDLIP